MANISLDYDGTFTNDPALWLSFINRAQISGHTIFVVTMRYPSECDNSERLMIHPSIEALGVKVIATSRTAKKEFCRKIGVDIHIWIDDHPEAVHSDATSIWGDIAPEGHVIIKEHPSGHAEPPQPYAWEVKRAYSSSFLVASYVRPADYTDEDGNLVQPTPLYRGEPPQPAAPTDALLEAVDAVLEQAPCECSDKRRYDRGEHLSGCYLFDLNIARNAMLAVSPVEPPRDSKRIDWLEANWNHIGLYKNGSDRHDSTLTWHYKLPNGFIDNGSENTLRSCVDAAMAVEPPPPETPK